MTDVLTPHSRIAIGKILLATGHWSGTRRGVRLDMSLENNLLGRMIVCDITPRDGRRKKVQITGATMFDVAESLRAKLARSSSA